MTEAHPPASTPETHSDSTRITLLSNILGIVGIIILVIIVLWGLFHLASLFASRSTKTATIKVTAPTDVTSGEAMDVRWSYTTSAKGSYALLYQCRGGLQFTYPVGGSRVQVPCGAAFTLGASTSSATVFPLYSGTSSVSVPLTILFIPSATTTSSAPVQGSVTVTVHPSAQTAVKPAAAAPAPAATGPADLSVSLVSLTADQYGNGVATFDISNIGGSPSGTYYFSAQLPTAQSYAYSSPAQASLAAGSHVVSTLNFTMAMPGTFSVSVSSSNDSNSANNSASRYLNTPYGAQYQYTQQYYPDTYQPYLYNQYQYPNQYQYYPGQQQCYWSGGSYVCPGQQYLYNSGQPYYVNTGQYPYIPY